MTRGVRVEGVDVARGLASVLMIQGHAFDGWSRPEVKRAGLYALESQGLQSLALPAFLVLAGAGVALRVEAAVARAEPARDVRRGLLRRGATLVAAGYALSAVSALLDGWEGPETWLRADVLHVIGLSLVGLAALGIRGRGAEGVDAGWLTKVAVALAVVPVLVCPWVSARTHGLTGPVGWVVGPFADVADITRMPVVPLVAWVALGVLVVQAWIATNRDARDVAGAPPRVVRWTLGLAVACAGAFTWLEHGMVAALGGTLSRAHPGVVANAMQLGARGVFVLGLGAWCAPRIPHRFRTALVRLGQGSLWAYAFHVPFCYGAPGRWLGLRDALSGPECVVAATGLVLASAGVVWARGWFAQLGSSRTASGIDAGSKRASGAARRSSPSPERPARKSTRP